MGEHRPPSLLAVWNIGAGIDQPDQAGEGGHQQEDQMKRRQGEGGGQAQNKRQPGPAPTGQLHHGFIQALQIQNKIIRL